MTYSALTAARPTLSVWCGVVCREGGTSFDQPILRLARRFVCHCCWSCIDEQMGIWLSFGDFFVKFFHVLERMGCWSCWSSRRVIDETGMMTASNELWIFLFPRRWDDLWAQNRALSPLFQDPTEWIENFFLRPTQIPVPCMRHAKNSLVYQTRRRVINACPSV